MIGGRAITVQEIISSVSAIKEIEKMFPFSKQVIQITISIQTSAHVHITL